MASSIHLALLTAEVAAARLEAILQCEPELGRLWRIEAAFGEAVRSVGLEDVRLQEGDLVARLTMNAGSAGGDAPGAGQGDPRGIEQAGAVLRILRQPGDVLNHPAEGLRRIEAAAAPIGVSRDAPDILTDEERTDIIAGAKRHAGLPIAGAMRAAAEFAWRSGGHAPLAERLVFSAVEGALRAQSGMERRQQPADGDQEHLLLGTVNACWIATPATSLTRRGFRIWSPLGTGFMAEFATMLAQSLSWDLGQVGQLRRHVQLLSEAGQGRRGRARHADFARWVPAHPVFSSAMVMDGIGVTRRTALSLIEDFTGKGVLASITPRRAARLWATASLAERLLTRSAGNPRHIEAPRPRIERWKDASKAASDGTENIPVAGETPALTLQRRHLKEENRAGMEAAMAELDKMMAEADVILAGVRPLR